MSSKSPADRVPVPPLRSTTNSRSGSGNESGRSKTALTTLKMAVFAPMPSASVSTATAVKLGFFNNWRQANLRSFIVQTRLKLSRTMTLEQFGDFGMPAPGGPGQRRGPRRIVGEIRFRAALQKQFGHGPSPELRRPTERCRANVFVAHV